MVFSQKRITVYDYEKQDSIIYISEGEKIYACPFKKNIGKTNRCEVKEELLPNTNKYTTVKTIFEKKLKVTAIGPGLKLLSPTPNLNYGYDLPYRKGEIYKITYVYNNALDFDMPEGTQVLAVRDGLVIEIVQDNNNGCPSADCAKYVNYVGILQSDNTMSKYFHLKYKGVKVKMGDKVKKGDVIGLSGNTGQSTEPHLHFLCYSLINKLPLKTFFRTGDGNRIEYLKEGMSYYKDY